MRSYDMTHQDGRVSNDVQCETDSDAVRLVTQVNSSKPGNPIVLVTISGSEVWAAK